MKMSVEIGQRVRLVVGGGSAVEGVLAGIEREEDGAPCAVLIRTLQVKDVGSLHFTLAEITERGWYLGPHDGDEGIEKAVQKHVELVTDGRFDVPDGDLPEAA